MQSHKVRTLQALLLVALEVQLITAGSHNPFGTFFSNRQARAIDGINPHSGEHCVDVSTYGPVAFRTVGQNVCESEIVKQCEQKTEQVCLEVTEIECEVEPYTICTMSMDQVTVKSPEMVKGDYQTVVCEESTEIVQHTKTTPDCKNVTRQNCITKWEFDDAGNKVWAGNENCEDVTWQECKLVERSVDFTVPKVDCQETGNIIPYMRFVNTNKTEMLTKMTCEVKSSASCKPSTSTKCKQLEWQECSESPVETCIDRDVSEPHQEREHRQKCIVTDGSVPRQGPVIDIGDPAAQTTASPETEEGLATEEEVATEEQTNGEFREVFRVSAGRKVPSVEFATLTEESSVEESSSPATPPTTTTAAARAPSNPPPIATTLTPSTTQEATVAESLPDNLRRPEGRKPRRHGGDKPRRRKGSKQRRRNGGKPKRRNGGKPRRRMRRPRPVEDVAPVTERTLFHTEVSVSSSKGSVSSTEAATAATSLSDPTTELSTSLSTMEESQKAERVNSGQRNPPIFEALEGSSSTLEPVTAATLSTFAAISRSDATSVPTTELTDSSSTTKEPQPTQKASSGRRKPQVFNALGSSALDSVGAATLSAFAAISQSDATSITTTEHSASLSTTMEPQPTQKTISGRRKPPVLNALGSSSSALDSVAAATLSTFAALSQSDATSITTTEHSASLSTTMEPQPTQKTISRRRKPPVFKALGGSSSALDSVAAAALSTFAAISQSDATSVTTTEHSASLSTTEEPQPTERLHNGLRKPLLFKALEGLSSISESADVNNTLSTFATTSHSDPTSIPTTKLPSSSSTTELPQPAETPRGGQRKPPTFRAKSETLLSQDNAQGSQELSLNNDRLIIDRLYGPPLF